MIAAMKVELRSLFGSQWVKLIVLAAILAPVIAYGLDKALDHSGNDPFYDGPVPGGLPNDIKPASGVSFTEALSTALPALGLISILIAGLIATSSHRHKVFQSYVVTGFAKDKLFGGRIAAAAITVLVVTSLGLLCATTLHKVTWHDAHCGKKKSECEYILSEYGAESGDSDGFHFSDNYYKEPIDTISKVPKLRIAAEFGSFVLLCLLSAITIVGITTLTRSVIAVGVLFPIYFVLEKIARDSVLHNWSEAAHNVPIKHISDVSSTSPDTWWSSATAIDTLILFPYGHQWQRSVLLLVSIALVSSLLGMYRLFRRDV